MSTNRIYLDNPIQINGETVSTLTYDYFEITNDLYLEACMRSSRIGGTMNSAFTRETNEALHLFLGKAAVIAVNPAYSWGDLDRIKGLDLLRVSNVGRFFITGKSESSTESGSDDLSETTPEPSPEKETPEE